MNRAQVLIRRWITSTGIQFQVAILPQLDIWLDCPGTNACDANNCWNRCWGTNTDAVLVRGGQVIVWAKVPTTPDVRSGIVDAVAHPLAHRTFGYR